MIGIQKCKKSCQNIQIRGQISPLKWRRKKERIKHIKLTRTGNGSLGAMWFIRKKCTFPLVFQFDVVTYTQLKSQRGFILKSMFQLSILYPIFLSFLFQTFLYREKNQVTFNVCCCYSLMNLSIIVFHNTKLLV